MLSSHLFLLVSLLNSLWDFHVSGCDYNCADKPVFTPSRLVVKYGDPASATCTACEDACHGDIYKLEVALGVQTENGTTLSWKVDRMTEWDTSAICFYNTDTDDQCCTTLPITIYQPPENVSISFVNHTGPMFEHGQYTLQCTIHNVYPAEKLTVTFYRGQTVLGQLQSNSSGTKTPVTETFTLPINTSKEYDGAQYRCEAELELGAEGPQPPPVVTSEVLTATVYYGPQLKGSANPDPITITEGSTLHLNCSSVGNPHPSYHWTLPSDSPPSFNGSVLTVQSVGFEHRGQYVCHVRSNTKTVTVNFSVDVQVNIIPYIIAGVIIVVVLCLFGVLMGYIHYYKHNRTGKYNIFRGHARHVAVPMKE